MDFQRHMDCYMKLLDDLHVANFFRLDPCGALCDKYHLIIVFQFFMRAGFVEDDYTPKNFFLALTLSHDLYDECKALKCIIFAYYLSRNISSEHQSRASFHWDKLRLFRQMQYRGFIEKKICQKLLPLMQHRAFNKGRKELHTGIVSGTVPCEKCRCPINEILKVEMNTTKRKKSCDMKDVSDFIAEDKRAKRRLVVSTGKMFFHDNKSDGKSIVTLVC